MSLPFFPLYVDDFEADTAHLSAEEDGVYNRLLRLCWRSPRCEIPADDKWIQRHLRLDCDTYERSALVIIQEYFERRGKKLHNPRLSKEYAKAIEAHAKRVSAGRRGGKSRKVLKRKGRDGEHCSSNASAMPKQPEPNPHNPQPPSWPHRNSEFIVADAARKVTERGEFPEDLKHPVEVMRELLARGISENCLKKAGAPVHWLHQ